MRKDRQLRVLIIVENLPVPFDTRVWKEACALQQSGCEVSVICPAGKGFRRGYEYLEGVHVHRHPMPPEGNGAAGYLLEYGVALFWEKLLAWKIFFTRGFDVIQGCNPPDNIFLIALPFKLFGVKYIFDHHDVNPELYYAKFERKDFLYRTQIWLERLTFACADVSMATNETYRQVAIERGKMAPEDVFVVRNGPDLATFRATPPRPELKYGKRFLVGYVGTMSEQEGLDILLNVAKHIRDGGRSDIHFTCIGGGPGLEQLRAMKTELGLDGMFNFTGRVPDEELLDILSTADICVNPDKPGEMNDMSTMIKIMEYMCLGKPIVQFDLKEGRFSAGEASRYASADDPVPGFAGEILHLLDNESERRERGDFGRERVERELAWEYSVPHLLAAYRRVFHS